MNKITIDSNKQRLIIYIVLTAITLAVYWQVNRFNFVNFDDNVYVTKNYHITSGFTLQGLKWAFSTTYAQFWHPLTWLSLMFDYQLFGLKAGGYHVTNLIFHIFSTLLLFWLFCRMTQTIWKSAFVAALFALHPLHVESVAWIAERKDVLSGFFWMLTLCLYVYYTEKPLLRRYLPVLLSFACALMSKPMVITLPVIMILLDYWPLRRLQSRKISTNISETTYAFEEQGKQENTSLRKKHKKKTNCEALKVNIQSLNYRKIPEAKKIAGIIPSWQLKEKIPFFVLSAVFSIITLYAQHKLTGRDFQLPLSSRISNAIVAFVTYLGKTFWPHNLAAFYPFPDHIPLWQVLGSIGIIILISAFVIVMIKRLPYFFVGWLWYVITILPVLGIIQISSTAPSSMADRYHYIPSIGIAVMLAFGIPSLIKSNEICKKILLPAGAIFLLIMAVLTSQQCDYWKNKGALFSHTLQVTKDNAFALTNFGNALYDEGKFKEAIEHYNKAISLKKDYFDAYNNRGIAYAALGQYQRAIEDYDEAIRLKPDDAQFYNNRGGAYIKLGQYQIAFEQFNKAISLKADYASPYSNRALIYFIQGNKEFGCHDAQKACVLGSCKILDWAKAKEYCR